MPASTALRARSNAFSKPATARPVISSPKPANTAAATTSTARPVDAQASAQQVAAKKQGKKLTGGQLTGETFAKNSASATAAPGVKAAQLQSVAQVQGERLGQLDKQIRAQTNVVKNSSGADAQLEMVKLQRLTEKRNEMFDLMGNVMQKHSNAQTSLVGNLR